MEKARNFSTTILCKQPTIPLYLQFEIHGGFLAFIFYCKDLTIYVTIVHCFGED